MRDFFLRETRDFESICYFAIFSFSLSAVRFSIGSDHIQNSEQENVHPLYLVFAIVGVCG